MIKSAMALLPLAFLTLIVGCSKTDADVEAAANSDKQPVANAEIQPDASGDQALLQGSWETIRMATDGADLPPEAINKSITVTFEGEKMITKRKGKVVDTWTFKLDPSKSPKQMTINRAAPGEEEKLSLLIYKIEDDTLTTQSGSRSFPTEFTPQTVKGCYLSVRQRIDDAAPPAGGD